MTAKRPGAASFARTRSAPAEVDLHLLKPSAKRAARSHAAGLYSKRQQLKATTIGLLGLMTAVFGVGRLRDYGHDEIGSHPRLPVDRYSIIVSSFRRTAHLHSFLDAYAHGELARLAAVHVAWGLGDVEPPDWITLEDYAVPVILERAKANSLSERFRIPTSLRTQAVFCIDDDLRFEPDDIEFAFSIWQEYSSGNSRIVGFSPGDWNLDADGLIHYQHLQIWRYSMIMTDACFLDFQHLQWFWQNDDTTHKSRQYVDSVINCEDILMNFVVSAKIDRPPLYVHGNATRIHSDELSQRRDSQHTRTDCLREFAKWWGMPLIRTDVTMHQGARNSIKEGSLDGQYRRHQYWATNKKFIAPIS